ncbi:MAG: alpha-amylase family glycosyl hydrolase [Candidatus Hydrogenedentota bacterium]
MCIERVYEELKRKDKIECYIPILWNYRGKTLPNKKTEIKVDLIKWIRDILYKEILSKKKKDIDYTKPLKDGIKTKVAGDWITKKNIMYGMTIRYFSAFDFNKDKKLSGKGLLRETGTILRAIALLPYLKSLGIDVVYLTPIMKYSDKFKKGDWGSVYATEDFYTIDPNISDPLLKNISADLMMKAFVESAHILRMRVLFDFVPRTTARGNNTLILKHPYWFTWVKKEHIDKIKPFEIPGHYLGLAPNKETVKVIYENPQFREYITYFTESPDRLDPLKWSNFVREIKDKKGVDVLSLVEKEFTVTVPPAFSDVPNDPQPPWSDVTYFKLFEDIPEEAKKYLPPETIPYSFCDTAKASNLPGTKPVKDLWEYISEIVPFFIKEYGFDGVRPDMAHALPVELFNMMLKKARDIHPDFCFFAEEIDVNKSKITRENGNNLMVGDLFWRITPQSKNLMEYVEFLDEKEIMFLGGVEIADSLRIGRLGEEYAKWAIAFIMFLPDTLPFCLNGQELIEKQPMNFGLVSKAEQKDYVKEDDHSYGKLAFYDKVAMHWENYKTGNKMCNFIRKMNSLRKKYVVNGKCIIKEADTINYRFVWKSDNGRIEATFKNKEPYSYQIKEFKVER